MENPVNGAQADCSGLTLPRCDDYEAFTLLYRQTAAAVYAYLISLCGCPHLAEDLLQETFLAAFLGWPDFQGRSSLRTWVHVIATNKFRDHCRKGWGKVQMAPEKLEALPAAGPAPPDAAIEKEERLRMHEAILALPPELRATLLLVRFEGLKYREAAAALGTTPATVRMQIHRAHRLLAQSLGEEARDGQG